MASQDINLRDWLDSIGLTQAVFADVAGLHAADVSGHCRGLRVTAHRIERMNTLRQEITDLLQTTSALIPNMRRPESIRAALKNLEVMREQADRMAQILTTHPQVA